MKDSEKCPAWEENETLRAGLKAMCHQFAFWSQAGGYTTGGLSALETAFELLGWNDPRICPEAQCDEPDCKDQASCGTPTANGYRHTCYQHRPTED